MSVNFDWLEKNFFKKSLSENERTLLGEMQEYRHRQSERIIEQGTPGGKLYILHAGKVRVDMTKNGVRSHLVDVEAGDVLGEMSFLSGEKTRADVVAKENCVVYVLSKEQFEKIMDQEKALAYALFQRMLGSSSHVVANLDYKLLPFLRVVSEKVRRIPLIIKLIPVIFTIIYVLAFIYISYKDFDY